MGWLLGLTALFSFLVSAAVVRLVLANAPRWGLVDLPDPSRKVHSTPTPLGGGIGIVVGTLLPLLGFAVGLLLVQWGDPLGLTSLLPEEVQMHLGGAKERLPQLLAILFASGLISIVGLIDDLKGLSWKFRLGVQFVSALVVVLSGVQATLFVSQPWVGQVVTVLWLVVMINSFNFLDNMDGLTSGIAFIAAVLLAVIMLRFVGEPRWFIGGTLLMFAGSLLGFLVYNRPPARIFMGDAGSTFVGLMMGTFTISGTFFDETVSGTHVILSPLCILAVPLYDFTSVMLIRLKRGLSPFKADKNHVSHRLVAMGFSRRNAVLTVHLLTLITGLSALVLYRVPNWRSASLVLAQVVCLLLLIGALETTGRRMARKFAQESEASPQAEPPSNAPEGELDG